MERLPDQYSTQLCPSIIYLSICGVHPCLSDWFIPLPVQPTRVYQTPNVQLGWWDWTCSYRSLKRNVSVPWMCPGSWGGTSAWCPRRLQHTVGRRCGSFSPRGFVCRSSTSPAGSARRSRPRRRSDHTNTNRKHVLKSWIPKESEIIDTTQNRALWGFLGVHGFIVGWVPGSTQGECEMIRLWTLVPDV